MINDGQFKLTQRIKSGELIRFPFSLYPCDYLFIRASTASVLPRYIQILGSGRCSKSLGIQFLRWRSSMWYLLERSVYLVAISTRDSIWIFFGCPFEFLYFFIYLLNFCIFYLSLNSSRRPNILSFCQEFSLFSSNPIRINNWLNISKSSMLFNANVCQSIHITPSISHMEPFGQRLLVFHVWPFKIVRCIFSRSGLVWAYVIGIIFFSVGIPLKLS